MKLSRRIALNGSQLDAVDPSVVIRSIDPGVPHESISAVSRMGGSGQRVTGQHWEYLETAVTYAINLPKEQLAERRAVFDSVNDWALQKGMLTIPFMGEKHVAVDKVVIPDSGDLREWNGEFTITFRAYAVPFWQDDTATTATIAAADESAGTITVPGQVETVCDAEITNASGSTINTMSVAIGDSVMNFTDLGLANGEKLVIGHNGAMLYIRIYTGASYYRRAMDKRTGGSDDLYVKPGANAIAITGGAVTATVSCRGRYL